MKEKAFVEGVKRDLETYGEIFDGENYYNSKSFSYVETIGKGHDGEIYYYYQASSDEGSVESSGFLAENEKDFIKMDTCDIIALMNSIIYYNAH